ncbi:hypothetical protein EDC04DRAFT_2882826 [Pisolithus marmoratus]|nr:hypothetical protein EDC04DRAFT_2882826 [Pisolithus marmoratus]
MSASERGYSGLIVHYLARLSPAPTPLAATIVGSPLFRPFSLTKLDALKTSFRHAVHTKLHLLKDAPTNVFLPSLNTQLSAWLGAILRGLEGGHAITRLACCSGLLLGVEDSLKRLPSKQRDVESSVQVEIVLAFADVIDLFTSSDSWRKEFRPETEAGGTDAQEDALTLSLITSAEALLTVPPEKFVALPLQSFMSGMFLSSFKSSMEHHPEYKIHVKVRPPFKELLPSEMCTKISSSPAMSHVGSLSRLCSRSISLFVDHRPKLALPHVQETLLCLESMSRNVESGWLASDLADAIDESNRYDFRFLPPPETRTLTESIWTILKTLLFSTIMVTEAGLSAVIYVPPEIGHTVPSLALAALRSLYHLAFVIEKFGGAGHSAFPELKRAFYLALDILAGHKADSEHFVRQLCEEMWSNGYDLSHPTQKAKKAFVLSAIEQLIPVLTASTIETYVLPFCSPHLDDAHHRDIFEAAHSVVLAIFSHCHTQVADSTPPHGSERAVPTATMVPFYTRCLIENSAEDKLNTTQLCLAFAALVKSASASGDPALAWFCIESVSTACKESSPAFDGDRVHRLHLALVSSVSSLPLALLSRALLVVDGIIEGTDGTKRDELLEALFQEIINNVGDAEKEFAVCWWNECHVRWARSRLAIARRGSETDGENSVLKESEIPSRL